MNLLDLLMLLILFVAVPLYAVREGRILKAAIAAGNARARLRMYRITLVFQWTLAVVCVLLWLGEGRPLAGLGLGFVGGAGWWIAAGIALLAAAALVWQTMAVVRSPEKRREVCDHCEPLRAYLPENDTESRTFAAVSITAGICEELLYRGFAIAVLAPVTGTIGAVAISTIGFGLGHAYQGAAGVAKTAGVGLGLALLFLLSGSLWIPMLVHAIVDLNSGFLVRRCMTEPGIADASGAAASGGCC